jgi:hypothetical protein
MKSFRAIMTLAMFTAVASANGQARRSKANVPFEFMVGDKSLPAGAYTIASATTNGNGLRIQCAASNDAALALTTALSGKSHPKLVFHRYGQRYFLAEVWSSHEDGRELMMSKQERAIQKEYSRLAANKSAPRSYETVAVALAVQ